MLSLFLLAVIPTTTPDLIRRGLFAEVDPGLFLTIGGRNLDKEDLPTRATSNLQPYCGVTIGYDLLHDTTFAFAVGLKLGMALVSSAGRASDEEINDPNAHPDTKANDFSIVETAGSASLSLLLTDRLALTFRLESGLGVLLPDPTIPALTGPDTPKQKPMPVEGAGRSALAFFVCGAVGLEYSTRLNGFTVGALIRFHGLLHDELIPGVSVTFPIKYAF